jgi:hypothetical protein
VELDHVFLLCDVGAPEADALHRLGLREGPPNTHPGQGTACRRFFFGGTYLELLWVSDEREARGAATARTCLWERWQARRSGACPVGVLLRPSPGDPADAGPPFPAWRYTPSYLPAGAAIEVGDDAALDEPFVAWLGFQRAPARPDASGHDVTFDRLTHARLAGPLPSILSPASKSLAAGRVVDLEAAPRFDLTLTFDGGAAGGHAELTAALPLHLRW